MTVHGICTLYSYGRHTAAQQLLELCARARARGRRQEGLFQNNAETTGFPKGQDATSLTNILRLSCKKNESQWVGAADARLACSCHFHLSLSLLFFYVSRTSIACIPLKDLHLAASLPLPRMRLAAPSNAPSLGHIMSHLWPEMAPQPPQG
jgi:hypothetical protein